MLAAAEADGGARPYLRAHPGLVTLVECADIGRPDDVDTPEDLARVGGLLAVLGRRVPALASRHAGRPGCPSGA